MSLSLPLLFAVHYTLPVGCRTKFEEIVINKKYKYLNLIQLLQTNTYLAYLRAQ